MEWSMRRNQQRLWSLSMANPQKYINIAFSLTYTVKDKTKTHKDMHNEGDKTQKKKKKRGGEQGGKICNMITFYFLGEVIFE